MEGFSVGTIASAVIKGLTNQGAKSLGKSIGKEAVNWKIRKQKLENYLQELTDFVSYFVTYRYAPQVINEAFVVPNVLSSELKLSYFAAQDFDDIQKRLEQYISSLSANELLGQPIKLPLKYNERKEISLDYIPAKKLINLNHSILIIGEAGAGKTALTQYICVNRLKQEKPKIPVYLDSRRLEKGGIEELIYEFLEQLEIDKSHDFNVSESLSIFIDGLDELQVDRYMLITREISDLHRKWPGILWVATCRSGHYGGELGFFSEYTISPFDEDSITNFITKWFLPVKEQDSDRLIEIILDSEKLREIAAHPLLLSLLCNAYVKYLDISRRQITLFEQCINSLLWQWDAKRAIKRKSPFRDLDLQKRFWLHAQLANRIHIKNKRYVDYCFLEKELADILPLYGIDSSNSHEVLSELVSHHSILVEFTKQTVGFGHFALQEFLVSKWYSGEKRWPELLTQSRLENSWWQNIFPLTTGQLGDASEAITAILEEQKISEVSRMKIAAACVRHDPIMSPFIRDSIIRKILDWFHNGNMEHKSAASEMLLGIDDDWSIKNINTSMGVSVNPALLNKILRGYVR